MASESWKLRLSASRYLPSQTERGRPSSFSAARLTDNTSPRALSNTSASAMLLVTAANSLRCAVSADTVSSMRWRWSSMRLSSGESSS